IRWGTWAKLSGCARDAGQSVISLTTGRAGREDISPDEPRSAGANAVASGGSCFPPSFIKDSLVQAHARDGAMLAWVRACLARLSRTGRTDKRFATPAPPMPGAVLAPDA